MVWAFESWSIKLERKIHSLSRKLKCAMRERWESELLSLVISYWKQHIFILCRFYCASALVILIWKKNSICKSRKRKFRKSVREGIFTDKFLDFPELWHYNLLLSNTFSCFECKQLLRYFDVSRKLVFAGDNFIYSHNASCPL